MPHEAGSRLTADTTNITVDQPGCTGLVQETGDLHLPSASYKPTTTCEESMNHVHSIKQEDDFISEGIELFAYKKELPVTYHHEPQVDSVSIMKVKQEPCAELSAATDELIAATSYLTAQRDNNCIKEVLTVPCKQEVAEDGFSSRKGEQNEMKMDLCDAFDCHENNQSKNGALIKTEASNEVMVKDELLSSWQNNISPPPATVKPSCSSNTQTRRVLRVDSPSPSIENLSLPLQTASTTAVNTCGQDSDDDNDHNAVFRSQQVGGIIDAIAKHVKSHSGALRKQLKPNSLSPTSGNNQCNIANKKHNSARSNRSSVNVRSMAQRIHSCEKLHQCDFAAYASNPSLARAGDLVRYTHKHTDEKPYQCDKCPYATAHTGNLVRHKLTHTGEKPYRCGKCPYAAARASSLVAHNRTHSGEKPYRCDKCIYASAWIGHLVRHKRTHTGEKPYQCDNCPFASADACDLVRHKRKHTGEKPYRCDKCPFAAAQIGNLVKHKRTHTGERPYQCDKCPYAAAQADHLMAHKRTHTGEKPYQCDKCPYAAAQAGHLVLHKRKHTGERPYQCDNCPFASADAGDFVLHKRTHTGEKSLV